MDVFSGDAWNIFDWELGCETLPVDRCDFQLWYDSQYWNDEGNFARSGITEAVSSKEASREIHLVTASVSDQSSIRQRSDAGTEVASTPILTKQECLPEMRLRGERSGMTAECPKNQLSSTLTSTNCPASAERIGFQKPLEQRTFHKSFGQRPKKAKPNATSQFKGVTKHRATGKFEAHLWDASVLRKGKNRRGRHRGKQIYLGSFSNELAAARTFDMAAICYWGDEAFTNFPLSDYSEDIELLKSTEKEKIVKLLRRSEGGYLSGSDRFVGLALFRTMQFEEVDTTLAADPRATFKHFPF